jgi:hypothetical protein
VSQKFKKRIGGFFGASFEHPMPSVFQNSFICLGGYNLHLLAEYSAIGFFAAMRCQRISRTLPGANFLRAIGTM